MRAFALAEIGDSEAIDVFLRREDAWAALAEILNDEPDWPERSSSLPSSSTSASCR